MVLVVEEQLVVEVLLVKVSLEEIMYLPLEEVAVELEQQEVMVREETPVQVALEEMGFK